MVDQSYTKLHEKNVLISQGQWSRSQGSPGIHFWEVNSTATQCVGRWNCYSTTLKAICQGRGKHKEEDLFCKVRLGNEKNMIGHEDKSVVHLVQQPHSSNASADLQVDPLGGSF